MLNLSTPQRQSKKIIAFYLFKSIKGLLFYFLFAAIGTRSMGEEAWYIIALISFVVIMSLVSPVIKYIYFTFHLESDELIIQKGLIQKERKAIPLERIQSINITQNVVQRILGIVSLEVDTAGSKAKELEIPGLDREFASQFKELLQERKEEIVEVFNVETESAIVNNDLESNTEFNDTTEDTSKKETTYKKLKEQIETPILKLGLMDLLKVGITQNHLKSGGLAIGVVFGSWYNIKEILEEYFGDWLEQFSFENVISGTSIGLAVAAIVAFLFFSVIISLILAINKYWNFSMVKKGADLEIEMGLLNKKEIKIPLSKVQILEFHSNPLRKLLSFQTAQIFQAQSTNDKLSHVSVPACTVAHQKVLQHLIFKEPVEETEIELICNPWSHARLRFYILSIFIIPGVGTAIYFEQYLAIIPLLLFMILLICMAFMYGKKSKIVKDDDFVVFKKGWLFPKTIISPIFKTQAVEKWRSVFLKRRREAHFKLHTAAGTRGLRYFKEDQLNTLINTVNNQVICSEQKWM
ncbi:PH domain-containing protein [Nonlabens sp. Asnod2-A12]|uniref:PH domain-containing protein n=1 Tax=Nonlabens sp. Asnod2-A12 TaxID=3160578 RepID=UPI003864184E